MAQTKTEKAAYGHSRYEAHREEMLTYQRAYYETHREEQRAYHEAHREEYRAANHAWRIAHLEEERVRDRAWKKAHPQTIAEYSRRRYALKRGATVGPIDLEAIKTRDRMRCCICGKKVDERLKYPHPDSLSFDHSHPLGLLGPHSQENQRVAHLRCNIRRGAGRLPVQMVLC